MCVVFFSVCLCVCVCLAHRNRSDFCDLRLRCPSRTPAIAAISETKESKNLLRHIQGEWFRAECTKIAHRRSLAIFTAILGIAGASAVGASSARLIAAKPAPRGPKDQNNSRFRSRLKISIENEIFERANHRSPIFCGGNRDIEIKIFERDQKFRSRLKISIEIKFF